MVFSFEDIRGADRGAGLAEAAGSWVLADEVPVFVGARWKEGNELLHRLARGGVIFFLKFAKAHPKSEILALGIGLIVLGEDVVRVLFVRGKFGEAQLELLLQGAGLREGHEYTAQRSTTDADSSGIPDVTVNMPGGSQLFIDSKFPFERFLEAFGTDDQAERDQYLQQHTKDLMKHVDALAKRGYHKSQGSPDFVVLFVPFETLLSEALRTDPQFLEKAFKVGVTVATPTSMMALLRTIGYIFSRNKLAENADEIQKVASTFLKNITLLHTKIVAVGKAISSTSKAYEDLVPTAEKTVLAPARRIHNLGVTGDKDKLAIEYPEAPGDVRDLKNAELDGGDDYIDAEEVDEK